MAEDKKQKKSETKDLPQSVEKLVGEISKLSVLELSQLVEALQDTLGVTAAAPMAAAAPAPAEGDEEAAAEGAGGGNVIMTAAGDNKISVIKALRLINQELGLKEAKDMTENLPAEILKDAKPDDAKEAADKLKEAGATVEVK